MIYIYLRTSTEDQTPENQLQDCLSINNFGEYEVIIEKQSAWKDKARPKFEELKGQIKKGKVEHLICWDWDRLFRNRKKLKEFFVFCKLYNCKVHSFRQQFFEDFYKIPSPFDEIIQELVLNLMGWLAEDESKKKSERVKIAFKNHKGNWGRKALSNQIKQRVIQLHKEGQSIRSISKQVIYYDKNRNPKPLSKSAVHNIIKECKEETSRNT